MKKVVLSLIIGGLSISGDCFAATNSFDEGSRQYNSAALQQVEGTWSKENGNTKKILENKKFQVAAIGTAAVAGAAGAAVAAYCYSPNFAEFVNSNAKVIATYTSNALRDVANYINPTPAPPKIANYIDPAPTFTPSRWDEARHVVNGFMNALGKFAAGVILFTFFKSLSYGLELHIQGM